MTTRRMWTRLPQCRCVLFWAGRLLGIIISFERHHHLCRHLQVRSQEEIMNECQVWWTITGNFGNMMPIDWYPNSFMENLWTWGYFTFGRSKSTARARHLPALNLCQHPSKRPSEEDSDEDEDLVAADLDMHSLILNSNPAEGTVRSILEPNIKDLYSVLTDQASVIRNLWKVQKKSCERLTIWLRRMRKKAWKMRRKKFSRHHCQVKLLRDCVHIKDRRGKRTGQLSCLDLLHTVSC